jgi:glycerol-3-phosphate acyltransferase PlsY
MLLRERSRGSTMKQCIIMTLIGFISGAIMYSYLIPRIFSKTDVRKTSDDGNPGSSNAIRAAGVPIGIICMALDISKAFAPVFIPVYILNIRGLFLIPVIVAPVAGHAFSPMMKFHGGKAVSTTYGSLLGLIPISNFVFVVAIVMAIFRFIVVIRPDSTSVITSMGVASILSAVFAPELWLKTAVILVSIIVSVKQMQRPDKGEHSVSIWHYSLAFKDNRLRFSKI